MLRAMNQQQQNKPKLKHEFGLDIIYFLAALFAVLLIHDFFAATA